MRLLAIDLGDKRTGLAAGDTVTRLAGPLDVLEIPLQRHAGEDLLAALARLIAEHRPALIILGLPLNMDGSEGPRATLSRDFAQRLAQRTGLPVHLQDERLTSHHADQRLARSGLTHKQKKQRRDALAAAALLEDYLADLARKSPDAAGP